MVLTSSMKSIKATELSLITAHFALWHCHLEALQPPWLPEGNFKVFKVLVLVLLFPGYTSDQKLQSLLDKNIPQLELQIEIKTHIIML